MESKSFHNFYITYKEAKVATREQFSLSESEAETLLHTLKEYDSIEETFVLSTCNRTEIYCYGNQNALKAMKEAFAKLKFCSVEKLEKVGFKSSSSSKEVIKRFFEVSVGIDSQIIGDWQITHQVKQAYQLAEEIGTIGTYFHKLLSYLLKTSKKITNQTIFRSGAASVSFATADLVRKITQSNLNYEPKILVVGVGKIGADTVRHLRKMGLKNVKITNRTFGKSAMLATENAYEVIEFDHVFEEAQKADIVISSISLPNFFNPSNISTQSISCHQCFIDLSMPRSIEHKLTNFIRIYNIDDLKEQTKAVRKERLNALPAVYEILNQGIDDFEKWKAEYEYISLLLPYKEALEELKNNISNKYKNELDDKSRDLVLQMLNDFSQKAMRIPVVNLKNKLNQKEPPNTLMSTMQQLFN